MDSTKSKVLIIGVTGRLGFELAKASLNSSHPTFGLGSLQEEETLVEALKGVDIVICVVSSKQVHEQKLLISAIKRAGCTKRFLPSEFGADPDRTQVSDLDRTSTQEKLRLDVLLKLKALLIPMSAATSLQVCSYHHLFNLVLKPHQEIKSAYLVMELLKVSL